ncbi:MAG: hypothetical protein R3E97_19290 [Candidatus Eisenbacteria bacterium]
MISRPAHRTLVTTLLGLLTAPLSILTASPAAGERTPEQASNDATAIHALYDAHAAEFEGIYGNVSVSGTNVKSTIGLCEERITQIEHLEESALPQMESTLAHVAELWGPTADEVAPDPDPAQHAMNIAGQIEKNLKMTAAGGDTRAMRDLPEQFDRLSTRYGDLVRMLSSVQKTRLADAQYLCTYVQNQYSPSAIKATPVDLKVPKLEEAKTLLTYARRFDPNNSFANDRLATLDAEIAGMAEAIEAEIDAKTWPGDVSGAPPFAKEGLAFLRGHPNWGGNENGTEVLAVGVQGDWVPGERDIFGRIISWGLPIQVAVTKPEFREKGRARVYELTLITQQGAPTRIQKAPPFAKYWVGDSWYIRLGRVSS